MSSGYVSRSEFARMAGVSPAAVTKACKGKLKPACVRDRIDPEHEAAKAYLARHDKTPKRAEPRQKSRQRAAKPTNGDAGPTMVASIVHEEVNIGAYADLSVRDIVQRFGTERAFKDWLEAHKKIEDVEEKRIRNQELRGELIRRDLVTQVLFSVWEDSNRRLLSDVPRTLVQRLYAAALSGIPKEESEQVVKELISGVLQNVKDSTRTLIEPGS